MFGEFQARIGCRSTLLGALHALNSLDIGEHAAGRVVLDKVVGHEAVRVEARERDELPDVAERREVARVALDLGVAVEEALAVPVEARGQVVGELLVREGRLDARGEVGGLRGFLLLRLLNCKS